MTQTEKLGLVLPDEKETYNINVFNENFRIIDDNIGGAENLADLQTETKASLVGAINEVLQKIDTNVDTLSNAIEGVTADVNLLEQGLQGANANISTLSTGLQSANADIATIRTSLQTVTNDVAAIRVTLQNVTDELGGLIRIVCFFDEENISSVVTCSNGALTFTKTVDSNLELQFDVPELGEWIVTLGNIDEKVNAYYFGIHEVDFRVHVSVALIPILTSNTGNNGVASASDYINDSTQPYKAFDGVNADGSSWMPAVDFPSWIQYAFTTPKVVTSFKLSIHSANYAPKAFAFQASNDGVNFIELGTYTNTITSSFQLVEFAVDNAKSYTHYRIYIATGTGNFLAIPELQFYGYER